MAHPNLECSEKPEVDLIHPVRELSTKSTVDPQSMSRLFVTHIKVGSTTEPCPVLMCRAKRQRPAAGAGRPTENATGPQI